MEFSKEQQISLDKYVKCDNIFITGQCGVHNPSSGYALDLSGNINFSGNLYQNNLHYHDVNLNYLKRN
jgi:hypothetical protein